MPQFTVNPHRFDPYRNFKFRVMWDGRIVAGVSKVSALKRSTETVLHRDGGALSRAIGSPGKTRFEPITLERGLTHDTAFEDWANLVFSMDGDAAVSLKGFRKDISIELLNLQGSIVMRFNIFRCWVSEYQALPELDANGASTAIERIVLENDGWARDIEVREPAET